MRLRPAFSQRGDAKEFSKEALHHRTRQKLRAMRSMANSLTERIALLAMAKKAAEATKAVPSPTTHFWHSSAIRDYAQWSSRAGRSWARQTGGETLRENRCRTRRSPTLLPGSLHTACKAQGSLIQLQITHSTRSHVCRAKV